MELFSEYLKKEHILSRVDIRIKLITAFAILIMVISYDGFILPSLVIIISLMLCLKMQVPLKAFAMRFSEPMFIALVIVFLKMFFSGNEKMSLFTVIIYKDGLIDGLAIAFRILGAVSIVALIGFSTPFTEFIAGLSWFRAPRDFVEILMFAYRYIFVLLEDAMVIYSAQKNRLGYSNIRLSLSSFGTLTGSLILKAFEHSHNITVSMIQRGYDGNMPVLKHKPFRLLDVALSGLIITATGIIWKI